jgi:hypothetical protein
VVSDATVEGNLITSRRQGGGTGDAIAVDDGGIPSRPGHVRILANRIDRMGTAIALDTSVSTLTISQNVINETQTGIEIGEGGSARHIAIDNNELLGVATAESNTASAFGIFVAGSETVAIVGNTIERVAPDRLEGDVQAGIMVMASRHVRISGNVVDGVGGARLGITAVALGIAAIGPFEHVIACENRVNPTTVVKEGIWQALTIESVTLPVVHGSHAVIGTNDGALLINHRSAVHVAPGTESTTVSSNVVHGGGRQSTCVVRVRGDILADTNHVTHAIGIPQAVLLAAGSITAATNRVRGSGAFLQLGTEVKTVAAVGNITTAGVRLGANALPPPWAPLNSIAP